MSETIRTHSMTAFGGVEQADVVPDLRRRAGHDPGRRKEEYMFDRISTEEDR